MSLIVRKKVGVGLALVLLATLLLAVGCGESIDVVDAGTYDATVDKVVPEEQEIYISLDDGRKLELYFTENTELLRGGQDVAFSELSQGADIRVTVEREGNRNVPTRVEIVGG